MKIVCVDNFGRESIADVLVAENIAYKDWAEAMCAGLNDKIATSFGPYYFRVHEDDYVLWRGMEELV